jgi:hypothetical protein
MKIINEMVKIGLCKSIEIHSKYCIIKVILTLDLL